MSLSFFEGDIKTKPMYISDKVQFKDSKRPPPPPLPRPRQLHGLGFWEFLK